jgi:hypothetical protein
MLLVTFAVLTIIFDSISFSEFSLIQHLKNPSIKNPSIMSPINLNVLLATFVVLTLTFGSLSAYEFVLIGNKKNSKNAIILTVVIVLAVLVIATVMVLPYVYGSTPTPSSTTTSTTTTTSPPAEFLGPTLTNETSGLKLEVTLSGTSVNPNGYLGVRFNLTGAQEVNASYVELDVFNSQNQQVKGLAYQLGHSTQTPQPGLQGQIGTLYWQAATDTHFNVNITPGTYTLIIGVTGENLTIKTTVNVVGTQ